MQKNMNTLQNNDLQQVYWASEFNNLSNEAPGGQPHHQTDYDLYFQCSHCWLWTSTWSGVKTFHVPEPLNRRQVQFCYSRLNLDRRSSETHGAMDQEILDQILLHCIPWNVLHLQFSVSVKYIDLRLRAGCTEACNAGLFWMGWTKTSHDYKRKTDVP